MSPFNLSSRFFYGEEGYEAIKQKKLLIKFCLLLSPCDLGVIANKGRRGSSWGPRSILNFLSKMTWPLPSLETEVFWIVECFKEEEIRQSLEKAKKNFEHQKGQEQKFLHLGGGHDWVYPFIKACEQSKNFSQENYKVLNIDAHLDTRLEEGLHSGTPFRRLIEDWKIQKKTGAKLYQWGIHPFCNGASHYFEIDQYCKILLTQEEVLKLQKEEGELIVSLDADALDASVMPAVSAINPRGIFPQELEAIYSCLNFKYFGIYEFNPLYDTISGQGAKVLAALIYQYFYQK